MSENSTLSNLFALLRALRAAGSPQIFLPERVALLYRSDSRDALALVLGSAIAGLALWGFIYTPLLVSWIAWFSVLRSARWGMSEVYARANPPPADAQRWEDYYCVVALVFGAIWGGISVYFYAGRDQLQELIVIFLISLVAIGTPATLAPSPKTFVGFIAPLIAPLVGALFARGDVTSLSVAMMMLLYAATVLWLYLSSSRALLERLGVDERNASLDRQVRESKKRLDLAIRASHQIIWEWEAARNTVYLDEGWAELIGAPPGETFLSAERLKDFVHPDDLETVAKAAVSNLKNTSTEYLVEHRVKTAAGEWKWILSRGQVVDRDENGRALRMTGVNIDISQRKRAEEELMAALQREKELSEMKSRFVSIASHEFRTPLATILSSSELIEHYSDTLSAEDRAGVIRSMQDAVRRMVAMLDDVLTIGKAEAGALKYQGSPVRIKALCEKILAEFRIGSGRQHAVNFQSNLEADEQVEMDERLLRHIFENLLTNAAKYSAPGKEILLCVMREDRDILIEVADQGIGIPLKDQARMFEGFFRASNVDNRQGTGLGLAIVKKAVELHHGQIGFVSEPGKGTRFSARLPLRRAAGASTGVQA